MNVKKLVSVIVTAIVISSFSSNAFAELFSVSAGVPISHSFSGEWSSAGEKVESDGVSGYFFHVKFPIMIGVGLETYETKIKAPTGANFDDMKLATSIYDVFYLLPIPVINITIGIGAGNVSLDCAVTGGTTCSDYFEDGTATQWWGQFGFPIFPFLDIHVSYYNVTVKVKGKDTNDDLSFDGTVMAVGAAFIF